MSNIGRYEYIFPRAEMGGKSLAMDLAQDRKRVVQIGRGMTGSSISGLRRLSLCAGPTAT
jgi:hypothetical protein